ncbi:MAG TPA: hypothetical protein VMR18_03510 [Candidatus Saccharimonadales bacterium]|nr:hypothetical protein [Candidatus Saccharimonadales bacterium]
MIKEVKKYLLLSQASLLGLLLICCLIIPSVVIKNGGVSNFGNHRSTIVIYILSFSLCIVFLCLAASALLKHKASYNFIGYLLFFLALQELLVLISTFPRHISFMFSDIHDYLGIVLFTYQLVLSIWFILKIKNYKSTLILIGEFLGNTIGLLSILKVIHFLFIGQFIGAIGFGVLLVTCLPTIIEKYQKTPETS